MKIAFFLVNHLNAKIRLESNFCFACTFLNAFENKLYLTKLKQNIVIDLRHRDQKKKNIERNFSRN